MSSSAINCKKEVSLFNSPYVKIGKSSVVVISAFADVHLDLDIHLE